MHDANVQLFLAGWLKNKILSHEILLREEKVKNLSWTTNYWSQAVPEVLLRPYFWCCPFFALIACVPHVTLLPTVTCGDVNLPDMPTNEDFPIPTVPASLSSCSFPWYCVPLHTRSIPQRGTFIRSSNLILVKTKLGLILETVVYLSVLIE